MSNLYKVCVGYGARAIQKPEFDDPAEMIVPPQTGTVKVPHSSRAGCEGLTPRYYMPMMV